MPEPKDYNKQDEWMGACVPMMMKDKGMEQDQAVAACMSMWREHDKKKESMHSFSFTELTQEQVKLKYIDGLAAGTFTAMSGDEVTFKPEELEDYVKNTQEIINSTKTESGEIVGLPIDKNRHDHDGGAGWIVGLELDKTRNIIRFLVNWTNEGKELIKNNIRRFFSPSTDPEAKVILGGSLTNWPATRNAKGQMILRPVEFSAQIKEIDMEKTLAEVTQELEDAKTANLAMQARLKVLEAQKGTEGDGEVTPEMLEFVSSTEGAEELGRQAQEIAVRAIQDEKRKQHVRDFVSKIVGGTSKTPVGLAVRPSVLAAALLSMPDKQRGVVEKVLEQAWNNAAVVHFEEVGLGGESFAAGKPLPKEYRELVAQWVASGKTAESWFEEVGKDLGMGNPRDWNLREFAKAKEE